MSVFDGLAWLKAHQDDPKAAAALKDFNDRAKKNWAFRMKIDRDDDGAITNVRVF